MKGIVPRCVEATRRTLAQLPALILGRCGFEINTAGPGRALCHRYENLHTKLLKLFAHFYHIVFVVTDIFFRFTVSLVISSYAHLNIFLSVSLKDESKL